jgi:predicted tellurium resistance membrane protein TerC
MMDSGWRERARGPRHEGRPGSVVLGLFLIALGALFFASEQLNYSLDRHGWPIFVIAPGLFLLLAGLAIRNEAGLGLAIPGGIIASVGLILAFQDATGAWASWAYAWALVAPGSVGVTLSAYGLLHRRMDLLDAGLRTAATGLGLFVGFGLFFENLIGIDRNHQSTVLQNGLPFLAVALGVLIVLMNLLPRPRSRSERPAADEWSANQPTPATAPAPPDSPAPPQV